MLTNFGGSRRAFTTSCQGSFRWPVSEALFQLFREYQGWEVHPC